MKRITLKTNYALALMISGALAAGPAFADKPAWAGGDREGKSERHEKHKDRDREHRDDDRGEHGTSIRTRGYFDDHHRTIAHDYYHEQFRSGRCPPGLARKHNGCMPPGHARKWAIGRPLPRDVVYYDVPQALIVQVGRPPAGHRYVRVATDILLIAIGTGMVVDAIEDLGGN